MEPSRGDPDPDGGADGDAYAYAGCYGNPDSDSDGVPREQSYHLGEAVCPLCADRGGAAGDQPPAL